MLTFIPTRLAVSAAAQPSFAEVCVEPASPTATDQSSSIIRALLAQTHPARARHRYVPGRIHRLGFPQSLFNLHTSTALAA